MSPKHPSPLENSADNLLYNLDLLRRSTVPVIVIRTREPFSTTAMIDHYVRSSDGDSVTKHASKRACVWAYGHGFGHADDMGIVTDILKDDDPSKRSVVAALTLLNNASMVVKDPANKYAVDLLSRKNIFVMQTPHLELTDNGKVRNPAALQTLLEISTKFKNDGQYENKLSYDERMLVLLVPPSFILPNELKDSVVVLNHATPGREERLEIVENVISTVNAMLTKRKSKIFQITEEEKRKIVDIGSSLTAQEFQRSLGRTVVENRDSIESLTLEDFLGVLGRIKAEVVASSEVLEIMKPIPISEVGGLEGVKEWISQRQHCFSEEAKAYGIKAPKGIALIGPPGTGKSLLAKTISYELGTQCIKLDIGKVFNALVGASEERLRNALEMVQSQAPCVLFIDEIDKAFDTRNSGGDSGVGKRIFGTLLTWMQENEYPVFMVVTANDVTHLPAEFLRKGRLDDVFSIGLPAINSRLEIVKIHLRQKKKNPDTIPGLEELARCSKNYIPSELESAVNEAIIQSFIHKLPLTGELILDELLKTKPLSVSKKELFEQMQIWARENARAATHENIDNDPDHRRKVATLSKDSETKVSKFDLN